MQADVQGLAAPPWPEVVFVDRPEDLSRVLQPGVSLCIWRRQSPPELAQFLGHIAQGEPLSMEFAETAEQRDPDTLLDGFPWSIEPARAQWAADLRQLVKLFRELTAQSLVRCKLKVVRRVDCPVFHTDLVPLRLICTYHGTGTDYVEARNVNHAALCRPLPTPAQTNAAIVRDRLAVQRMRAFDVGIFKGDAFPGHSGQGIIHRSPVLRQGDSPRIKLILDTVKLPL